MVTLPVELWFQVVEYLSPRDLLKLVAVNRVFFNMIMDELYGQLSFISADPHVFSDKLNDLQNPDLASRVRVLTIWPSAIREAMRTLNPGPIDLEFIKRIHVSTGHHPRPPTRFPAIRKGRDYVDKLLDRERPPSTVPCTPPPPPAALPAPNERLEMFQNAIRHLKQVEEYQISWYLDTGVKSYAWKFPYFAEIWHSIGHNLRRLSVDVHIHRMNQVLESSGSLNQLEHLHLTMRREARDMPSSNDTFIPYFLNKLAPTLQSLSLKAIGHQEFTFFQLLGQFPHLNKLSFEMPLDAYHLRDPVGFQQFLRNHPNVRSLRLRHVHCCRSLSDDGFATHDGKHKIYSNLTLPTLQSLEFGLNMDIFSSKPNLMLSAVGQLGEYLTSLTLKDRSLTLEEAKTMLRAFPSRRLKTLSMFARRLSPQLIDVLAQTCPSLNSLTLDVQSVVKSEEEPAHDEEGFAQALFNYAVDLDNDRWRYRTWTLADISILTWRFKVGHQYNMECMKAIAYIVPNVRSFAGRGDMREDHSRGNGMRRLLVDLEDRTRPLDT
ncbi:hypothetical protein B0H34DRAFT_774685 [Crassisporium funariophilum]|nr:hypothetical protein B0H34DRAFT_774685 [Crassisporium funariophilum]